MLAEAVAATDENGVESGGKEVWGHFPVWVYREIQPGTTSVVAPAASIKGYQLVGVLSSSACLKTFPSRLAGVIVSTQINGSAEQCCKKAQVAMFRADCLAKAVCRQKAAWRGMDQPFCYLVQGPAGVTLENLLHPASVHLSRVVCYSLRGDGSLATKAVSRATCSEEFRRIADRLLASGVCLTPGGGLAGSDEVVCTEMYGAKMELSLPCTLATYRLEVNRDAGSGRVRSAAMVFEGSELVPGDRVRVGGYIAPNEDFERMAVGGKVVNRGMRTFADVVQRMHKHVIASYEKKSCIVLHDGSGSIVGSLMERALASGSGGSKQKQEPPPEQAEGRSGKLQVTHPPSVCVPAGSKVQHDIPWLQVVLGQPPPQRHGGSDAPDGGHERLQSRGFQGDQVQGYDDGDEARDLGKCIVRTLGPLSDKYPLKRHMPPVSCKHNNNNHYHPNGRGCSCLEQHSGRHLADAGQFSYKKRLVMVAQKGGEGGGERLVVQQVWDPAQVLAVGWAGVHGSWEWACSGKDPAWMQKHGVGALDPSTQWACYTKRSPPGFDPRAGGSPQTMHGTQRDPFA